MITKEKMKLMTEVIPKFQHGSLAILSEMLRLPPEIVTILPEEEQGKYLSMLISFGDELQKVRGIVKDYEDQMMSEAHKKISELLNKH